MSARSDALKLKAERLRADAPKTNHLLHFFICLFTGFLWLPFWIGIGLVGQHRQHYALKEARALEDQILRELER